ncbi:ATP-binding protein [Paenibacillus turpanensis]|uniref:ATP-binding protein n=1 Tax=Paenibacillus turpanensis TaxID=2689078 RepID=UPI00140D929B|nr:ATP-binding protein [Paenibacillus turpanensis]
MKPSNRGMGEVPLWRSMPWRLSLCVVLGIAVDQIMYWLLDAKLFVRVWALFSWTAVVFLGVMLYKLRENQKQKQKEIEREIGAGQELLEQSEKLTMVGVLAAGIAHEIRNPLTSLRGFVQLTQGNHPEYSRIMLSEIDRINQIVGEMLVLAKPSSPTFEPQRIDRVMWHVMALMRAQALLKNVELNIFYDRGAEAKVIHCEENRIKQVFINIIKNGIEAMPQGGLIEVKASVEGGYAVIQVLDEGTGMTKEQLEQVGKPFFSGKEKGTGLGIMVCQRILDEHSGFLRFEPNPSGKGTAAIVGIPLFHK